MRIPCKVDSVFLVILLAAAFLFLFHLDHRPFWQDEAETACLAKSVLNYGVPRAFDGVNLVSQEEGREFDAGYLWRWSPWLQIYLVAGAFKIFGCTNAAGRLFFALCGLGCVCLIYFFVKRYFGDLPWARMAAASLASSVTFLLFSRQCRYYSLGALLVLTSLYAFRGEWRSRFGPAALLVVSLVLMFYTNYLLFFSYTLAFALAAVLIYWRELSLTRSLAVAMGVGILIAPGLTLFLVFKEASMLRFISIWSSYEIYFASLFQFMAPMPIALVLLSRWGWALGRNCLFQNSEERFLFFLALIIFFNIIVLGVVPQSEIRYLIVLSPLTAIILGWTVCKVWRYQRFSGALLAILLCFTNFLNMVPMTWLGIANQPCHNDNFMLTSPNIPLKLYLTELFSSYPDTNQALIQFFQTHAQPGEVIFTTYGDLPLQFYTNCQVLGGLQGRLPPPGEPPSWVVKRWYTRWNREQRLNLSEVFIENHHLQLSQDYQALVLPAEDEYFGNNPDPYYHRFVPPWCSLAQLTIYQIKSKVR